jgi:hypothetical protein
LFARIAARGKNEDPGGVGKDVDGDVSGDEAVWRDLIARYEIPAAADATAMPWPERENLPNSAGDPSLHVADAPPAFEPGLGRVEEQPETSAGTAAGGTAEAGRAEAGRAEAGTTGGSTAEAGTTGGSTADAATGAAAPANGDRRVPGAGGDRTRIVRRAQPVPRPSAADAGEDEDDRYVPPLPPPLPALDSVGKGAWAALFGGPAYLVVATILGWSVSSWAALAAIGAFVGGFAVVILRMGDGPSRGDGPDNGAVV